MRIYSSLWNADDWATRGGLVKTDWTKAPFTAYYRNFKADACTWSYGTSSCGSRSSSSFSDRAWQTNALDAPSRRRLRWVQKYFMIYNYCADLKRFPQGLPPECRRSRFWEVHGSWNLSGNLWYPNPWLKIHCIYPALHATVGLIQGQNKIQFFCFLLLFLFLFLSPTFFMLLMAVNSTPDNKASCLSLVLLNISGYMCYFLSKKNSLLKCWRN